MGYRLERIAILLTSFGDGGVERMLVNLARGFAGHGIGVDFYVRERARPYLDQLGDGVRLIELGGDGAGLGHALLSALQQQRPDVLMSAKGGDDELAIAARRALGAPPRLFLRCGTNIPGRLTARRANPLRRWLAYRGIRAVFGQADGIICVSQGVADDLAPVIRWPRSRLHVLPNPVLTPQLERQAAEVPLHPWFHDGGAPVLIGIGGLRQQKNFALLLRAFARVRAQRPCRLLILGEGRLREDLLALAARLGVAGEVDLPGFVDNPYACLARAALFVLSSSWEGTANALIEALAVGTPAVATDCPSGPREILAGGRYGPLVPVGDEAALTAAMLMRLAQPRDSERLRATVRERYSEAASVRAYLDAFAAGCGVQSS